MVLKKFASIQLNMSITFFLKFNDTNLILIAEIDTSGGIRANVFPDTILWEVNARRSTLVRSLIAVAVISWSATGLVIYFLAHRRLLVAR